MKKAQKIDWWIIVSLIPLLVLSLSTMNSLGLNEGQGFFTKQVIWSLLAFFSLFFVAFLDLSFLEKSKNVFFVYLFGVGLLILLVFFGVKVNGARSWFSLAGFTFQPADLMKPLLALVLAKYLARRHVEIRSLKHVIITALYFLVPFLLIFLQPDFGSAIILLGIWFGVIMISGLSKKHILYLVVLGISLLSIMWAFVLKDYQKKRIINFIHPLTDIRGTGYNAYQSTIAVGSGKLLGKGVGYGTQSRLSFLPEYETDFIFAAISEEWGFVGSVIILFLLFFIVIRLIIDAYSMNNNFKLLFTMGIAFYFMTHIIINIGMNIGIMPVTGVTLPFVSYGGSHLLIEFISLGIVMSMLGRGKRIVHRDDQADAFLQ